MVLVYEKDIKDNVFYMTVKCKELGNSDILASEEEAMLINFPTAIEYKDITFEGKFNVDSNGDVIEDSSTGETVSLKLNNKVVKIDKDFKVDFSISTKMIKTEEIGTILKTKELVAEAKALCFKNAIKNAIKQALEDVRNKTNNYETIVEEETI